MSCRGKGRRPVTYSASETSLQSSPYALKKSSFSFTRDE